MSKKDDATLKILDYLKDDLPESAKKTKKASKKKERKPKMPADVALPADDEEDEFEPAQAPTNILGKY